MDKRTYDALQKSIRHWEKNTRVRKADNIRIYDDDCALCGLFLDGEADLCEGCPVRDATGKIGCLGSPYENARYAGEKWRDWSPMQKNRERFRAAALEELNFLRALVPAGGPDE